MKIRALTCGINVDYPIQESTINKVAKFCLNSQKEFEAKGFEVQEPRITTQPWSEYLGSLSKKEIIEEIKKFEYLTNKNQIKFTSIGMVEETKFIDIIPEIIKFTDSVSITAKIADIQKGINYKAIKKAAKVIKSISQITTSGLGNFRFAALANCPSDIPFYPASYHYGKSCFSIGLECSDIIYKAFSVSKNLKEAEINLRTRLIKKLKKLEKISIDISKKSSIEFKGIDTSIAPSLKENESIVYGFEKLISGKFGQPGTLSIASMVTEIIKSLDVKKCGYSGLMLPVLEDVGLAKRYSEKLIDLDKILLYSSVCGTGLDCIPLPGNTSAIKISEILLDVASLSLKLNKPLSARLFPVPEKKDGEIAEFNSPFLVDCKIMQI